MKIDKKAVEYLSGCKFSNGEKFHVGRAGLISRNKLIMNIARGKKVLHIGCADHVPLIEKKRAEGRYLHDLVGSEASALIGADINHEAIEKMREYGFRSVYHLDEVHREEKFDLLLVPDVIEHVPNVGAFLESLTEFCFDELLITTPNAYRLRNRILFRQELINTDHRCWFSAYTLAKTVFESNFRVKEIFYTDVLSKRAPIRSFLKWKYPLCRDGLALLATKE